MVRIFDTMTKSSSMILYWFATYINLFSTFLWLKMLVVESPLWLYVWSEEYFFFEISLFSKSLTRLPQAQITANVCSLTQLKMAFKYLNLVIIRNQFTVHSNRSLSRGLQTIWGAKTDAPEIRFVNHALVLESLDKVNGHVRGKYGQIPEVRIST